MKQKTRTVAGLAKLFLTEKYKQDLKESTYARYAYLCKKYITPYFGEMTTEELNNQAIKKFINHLQINSLKSNPLAPKTVNDILNLFLQIVKRYCNFEIDIKKPSYMQSEINVFTEVEYSKLKSYLSVGKDNSKLGIMIATLTGIRLGELCALKWENIDLENGVMYINKTIQRVNRNDGKENQKPKTKIVIDTPKSVASIRTIPLPLVLINTLNKFKSHPNTYILTNTKKYIEPRIYQRHFKAHLKACNIKDCKFHTLRHTFATMAIERSVDIKTLSVLLGHSDVSFTMRIYVHPNLEHKRNQIEKLALGF